MEAVLGCGGIMLADAGGGVPNDEAIVAGVGVECKNSGGRCVDEGVGVLETGEAELSANVAGSSGDVG